MPYPRFPKLAAQFRKLSQYTKEELEADPSKNKHKVDSTVNMKSSEKDGVTSEYMSSSADVTDLNTGETTIDRVVEEDGKASSTFATTDSSGNTTSMQTTGDDFEKTKLFKPKT